MAASEFLTPLGLQFLALVNRYRRDMLTQEQYITAVNEYKAGVEAYVQGVLANVPISEDADAAARQNQAVKILQDAAADLESVIPQVVQFAQAHDDEKLYQELVDHLGRMGSAERFAVDLYYQGTIPNGPTDMPFVNAVYYDLGRFFAGEIPQYFLECTIDRIAERLQGAENEVNNQIDCNADSKGALLYAYDRFRKALMNVREAIPEGETSCKLLMEEVTACSARVRDAIKIFTFQANTSGPTKMLQANLMISMCQAWKDNRLEAEVFLRGLEIFQADLDKTWRQLQAMASLPHDGDEIEAIMEPLKIAYQQQFQAVELYRKGVAGDAAALDEAHRLLCEGADTTAECREKFTAMGDDIGKVDCMRCGTKNEPGSRTCVKCGAYMIADVNNNASTMSFSDRSSGGGDIAGQLRVTPQLKCVFDAVNNVAEGTIQADEYLGALNAYEQYMADTFDVQKVSDNLLRLAETGEQDNAADLPQRVDEVTEELSVILHGIGAAIETLRLFAYETDSRHICDGVRALRDQHIKLQGVLEKIQVLLRGSAASDEGDSNGLNFASFGEDEGTSFTL